MARKRTKKEARERIRNLPNVPIPPVLGKTPVGRAAKSSTKAARFLAERLVSKDPLDRLQGDGFDIFGRKYLKEAIRRSQEPPPVSNKTTPVGVVPPKTKRKEMKTMADADEIIDAFLMGLAEGAREGASRIFPSPEQAGRSIGRRAISGRSRSSDIFGALELQAMLSELEDEEVIEKKKPRKRSKYNKELSKQLKKLRKEKPRTKQTALMKEAHKRTRKALGMRPKRSKRR